MDEALEGGLIAESQGHRVEQGGQEGVSSGGGELTQSREEAPAGPANVSFIEDEALLRAMRKQAKEREAQEAAQQQAAQEGSVDEEPIIKDKELLKYLEAVK